MFANSQDEYQLDYSSGEEEMVEPKEQHKTLRQFYNVTEDKVTKRKRTTSDDFSTAIKRLKMFTQDVGENYLTKRVNAFIEEEKDIIRKKLGDDIFWQPNDDEANKRALLDDTVTLIMQARKAIMSRENEGVTVMIEAAGWEDPDTKIRPKYSISIKRVKLN